jgi:hypothetical protein
MSMPWSVNAAVRTNAPGSWRIRLNAVVSRTRSPTERTAGSCQVHPVMPVVRRADQRRVRG